MGTLRDDFKKGGVISYLWAPTFLMGLLCVGVFLARPPRANASTLQTSITISICGNGVVDSNEVCDQGAGNNTGGYGSSTPQRICAPDCQSYGPYCGDGILQVRFTEQCDQGALNGVGGICSALCVPIPPTPPSPPPQPSVVLGSIPSLPNVPTGVIPSSNQTQVVLRGKGYPNSDIHILLDGKPNTVVRADSNADFLFNTKDVTPGTATFSFWAKDSTGVTSVTTSVVFDIVQSAVTSVANIFLPPTLSLSSQQIAPGGLLTLFGQSVPKAKVITNLEKDTSSTLASDVDPSGNWALQLDTSSIAVGFHSAKVSFLLSTTSKSGFGKSLNFFVGSKLPAGGPSPDLNGDGKVNLVDFSIFLLSWNTHDIRSDFNEDGIVNLADFSIMLFAWTG